MRKGSFSVRNNVSHSTKHNNREQSPRYLIDTSVKNYYEQFYSDDEFINLAQERYKKIIKQNMQKKQIPALIKEAVITIKDNQDQEDIKELFKNLNAKYGGHHLLEIAIHKDEGYFQKDNIAYYPTKNILKKDNDWYICSNPSITQPRANDFDLKVNIAEFEKVYNYHAHAKFSMFDLNTAKTARMDKGQMSSRIKLVSDFLGLDYAPDAKTSRVKKSVNQIKDEHLARAKATQINQHQERAKQKDLKAEIAELRKQLQEQHATRKDYAQLEQLNKELKEQIKQKTLSYEDLQDRFNDFKEELLNRGYCKELSEEEKQELKSDTKADNLQKLEQKHTSKKFGVFEKIDYRQISQEQEQIIKHQEKKIQLLQGAVAYQEQEKENFFTQAKEKIKQIFIDKIEELKDDVKYFKELFEKYRKESQELSYKLTIALQENEKIAAENRQLKAEINELKTSKEKVVKYDSPQETISDLDRINDKYGKDDISLEKTNEILKTINQKQKDRRQQIEKLDIQEPSEVENILFGRTQPTEEKKYRKMWMDENGQAKINYITQTEYNTLDQEEKREYKSIEQKDKNYTKSRENRSNYRFRY